MKAPRTVQPRKKDARSSGFADKINPTRGERNRRYEGTPQELMIRRSHGRKSARKA